MEEDENAVEDGLLFISGECAGSLVKGIGPDYVDELVGRVRIPGDDRLEMRCTAQAITDYYLHIGTVGGKSGVVSIWRRKSGNISQWGAYLKAVETLRRSYKNRKETRKISIDIRYPLIRFRKSLEGLEVATMARGLGLRFRTIYSRRCRI